MKKFDSPLFEGILSSDFGAILGCIGYHVSTFAKGEIISFETENIKHVGIVLRGAVDMIKEDVWGNKTMIIRMHSQDLFGETFACGSDTISSVTFIASENTEILFLPFQRVMNTCSSACVFHQRLLENMVRLIADRNRDLLRKIEIISKKTLREKILAYLSLQAQINKNRYFEIPLGRVELADYLCADRSALTRELSKMKSEGLIDYDKNMFRIL